MDNDNCAAGDTGLDCSMCLANAFESRADCGWCLNAERCVSTQNIPEDCNPDLIMEPIIGEENCWFNLGYYGSLNCSAHMTCHECLSNFNCLWCDTTANRPAINALLKEYVHLQEDLGIDPFSYWINEGHGVVNQAFLDMAKVLQRVDLMNVLGWEAEVEEIPTELPDGYCFNSKFIGGKHKICNYDGIPRWTEQ